MTSLHTPEQITGGPTYIAEDSKATPAISFDRIALKLFKIPQHLHYFQISLTKNWQMLLHLQILQ